MADVFRMNRPTYKLQLTQEELDGLYDVLTNGLTSGSVIDLSLFDLQKKLDESGFISTKENRWRSLGEYKS